MSSNAAPLRDSSEIAPLLDQRRGYSKQQKQDEKITLFGLFALAAVASTLHLGQRLIRSAKEPPYPGPPKVPPVCGLDHIEGVTTMDVIPGALIIKLFQVILDENITGNIRINLHDDLDIRDVYVTKTYKYSDPSIKKQLVEAEFGFFSADPPRYTLHHVLRYGLDDRQRLFYDGHECARVDVQLTFPRGYGFDHIEIDSRYKGNIDIQMQGFSDGDSFNTFRARAAHGDIIVNGTSALEMTLQAPAGAIDALIEADMHLTTYSAEDTVVEYVGRGLFVDALVVSEKRATLKWSYKGHFTLQSAKRPQVTGYQDVVVNVTKEDKHTLEGTIGVDWQNPQVFPRLNVQGHEAVLHLKEPPQR
ncbi:hypothetical protein BGZ82_011598 [Podila clonocystis]|nr:hypothetical protein BGZ82_011598 [Podila clonocystis]